MRSWPSNWPRSDVPGSEEAQMPELGKVEKLFLSLEMGDNVMIYLDDIQHCNPEFLQNSSHFVMLSEKSKGSIKAKPRHMIYADVKFV